MSQSMLPPSTPERLDPSWSILIVVVAVLFLIAVFAFYYYVR